jgi:hypothetical protein
MLYGETALQGRWEDAMDDDDEKGNLENPWNLSDLI